MVIAHGRLVGGRTNLEMATEAAFVIANLGFAEGAVVAELAIEELAGSAFCPKLAGAHVELDADHFGFAARDVARFMPGGTGGFEMLDASRKPKYTRSADIFANVGSITLSLRD